MKFAMIILFICSGIFLTASVILGCIVKFQSGYEGKAVATVVNIRQFGVDGDAMLTPVFEFDYNGRKYTVSKNLGSTNCKYKVGDKEEIKFDIDNPNKFTFNGSMGLKALMIVFLSIALVLLIVGAVLFCL